MVFPSFKKRKPRVYVSFGIYMLLIVLIIFESCLNSSLSGARSDFFAKISAFFVNLFNGPQVVEVIKPSEVNLDSDTTVLGQGSDGYSNIVIGTTSRIILNVDYPNKKHEDDTFDRTFKFTPTIGEESHYEIKNISYIQNTEVNKYRLIFFLVAKEKGSDLYTFNISFAETINYDYSFHIVDIATPTDFEAKVEKSTLKIGESTRVLTKLNGDSRGNWFLSRYYDISKISRSSSNPAVATIDEEGVIHALSNGNTTISYGEKSFDISVTNEHIVIPSGNVLSIDKDTSSNDNLHLLDYDYVFNGEDQPNDYSVLVYSSFSDSSLEDKTVSWSLNSSLKAKLSPFKYDEEGFPVYKDDSNRECIRVSGYREEGVVTLTCKSNADALLSKTLDINIAEAFATSMEVNLEEGFEMMLGDQKIVKATFAPKNTNNTSINITCSDPAAIELSNNNSSSVTFKANKIGNFSITVKSLSNESLTKTINFKIKAKQVINENNFNSFASFMRKFAGHMGLFFVTSIAGFVFFYLFLEKNSHRLLFSIVFTLGAGLFIAGLSELIQYFVPSRSGMIRDVGIDFLGVVLATAICAGIYFIIKAIKKAKNKKKVE